MNEHNRDMFKNMLLLGVEDEERYAKIFCNFKSISSDCQECLLFSVKCSIDNKVYAELCSSNSILYDWLEISILTKTVLILFGKNFSNWIHPISDNIINLVESRTGFTPEIDYLGTASSIRELSLLLRTFFLNDEISYVENLFEHDHEGVKKSTMVSSDMLRKFINLFERGDFRTLQDSVSEQAEIIRQANASWISSVEPTSIKRFFVELSAFTIHTAYDYGVDVDQVTNYEDPYQVIFSMNNTPQIIEWYISLCKTLYKAIQATIVSNRKDLVAIVDKCIFEHTSQANFGVAEIADLLGLSPAYLGSCYKKLSGDTIIKRIGQIRMEAACKLLRETDFTIGEISKRTGYSSENHFFAVFKKKYQMTPSEYRKNAV